MDWVFLWAMTATVAALWCGLSYRRERRWKEHYRGRADRWRSALQDEEMVREPPFLAPAAERIEAGQLVVVKTDGTVAVAPQVVTERVIRHG